MQVAKPSNSMSKPRYVLLLLLLLLLLLEAFLLLSALHIPRLRLNEASERFAIGAPSHPIALRNAKFEHTARLRAGPFMQV